MKKFTLSMVIVCTLCAAAAIAQTAPGSAGQGTSQSSPGMSNPRGQTGMGQPGQQNDPMGQTGQDQSGNTNNNRMDNGEHKLKGCVQSQGGQYMLETKKGKMVALTGQDISAHVGHEISVKGTWANGMSQSSTGSASGSEKTFNVTDVKMISDTCGGKGKHSEGSMGTGANGTNPNGSGTGASGPSGGTGTQPPQ